MQLRPIYLWAAAMLISVGALVGLAATANALAIIQDFQKVRASSPDGSDFFGEALGIDASGDTIVSGAHRDDDNTSDAGAAYVLERQADGTFAETQKLLASDGDSFDFLGFSAAVDGDFIVVGAPREDTGGSLAGSAYIYQRQNDGSWAEIQKIQASDVDNASMFGSSVAIDGPQLVVGAEDDDGQANNAGAAYIFELQGDGTWLETAKITLPLSDPNTTPGDNAGLARGGDRAGRSVAISGNTVVMGVPLDTSNFNDISRNNHGSAAVFTKQADGTWAQEQLLLASDVAANDEFGQSVAVSGDRIVVGGPLNDDDGNRSGSAYIFERNNGVWAETTKLTASDAGDEFWFGYAVDLDGDTAAIGAWQAEGTGVAYSYEFDGSAWQEVKLVDSDVASNDRLGFSIGVANGIVAAGSPADDFDGSSSGSLVVFDIEPDVSAPTWPGGVLNATNITAGSVDLQWDGAVDDTGVSFFRVFQDGVLVTETSDTSATIGGLVSEVTYEFSVQAVDASENESTDGPSSSVTTIFGDTTPPEWPNASVTVSNETGSGFALSWTTAVDNVSVAGYRVFVDGSLVTEVNTTFATVTGLAATTDFTVTIEAFDPDNNQSTTGPSAIATTGQISTQTEAAIVDSGVFDPQAFLGTSSDVDGNTIVVGAPRADTDQTTTGAAYVFTRNADGTWSLEQVLFAADRDGFDDFGAAVTIDGDTIVVTAPREDSNGSLAGSAYVFTQQADGQWLETQKIQASDVRRDSDFGTAVAIDGDRFVVGAEDDDDAAQNAGAGYVFERQGQTWVETAKLVLPVDDPAVTDGNLGLVRSGDNLGSSVGISGDLIILGAPTDTSTVDDATRIRHGSASVFALQADGSWSREQSLAASDLFANDEFGHGVAISGERAIVGAPFNDDAGNRSGAAYIFERQNGAWVETDKITASDASEESWFGWDVDIDGDSAIVGAYRTDEIGASYLLSNSGAGWSQSRLGASDAEALDRLGWSVAINGTTTVSGATGADVSGTASGAAYIHETDSDTERPTWPGGGQLDVVATTTTSIDIEWNGAIDNIGVDRYSISLDGQSIQSVDGTSTTITGLTPSQSYEISVQALDVAGNISSDGPTVTATTEFSDVEDPVWPNASLTATNPTQTTIELSWSTATDNIAVLGYRVFVDGTETAELASTSTTLTGLAADTTFTITVEAFDAEGNQSSTGPSTSASTVAPPPVDEPGDPITETQKLDADPSVRQAFLGEAVAVDSGTVIAGAHGEDVGAVEEVGAAYLFELQGNTFSQTDRLSPANGDALDHFGFSVDVLGDRAIVGAPGDDDGGTDAGAAYVFERQGDGSWVEIARLQASDASASANFGSAVGIDSDLAVVGASGDDVAAPDAGAGYVFARQGNGDWIEVAKLVLPATDPGLPSGTTLGLAGTGDSLGFSADISGTSIALGAPSDESLIDSRVRRRHGAVAVFVELTDGSWTQQDYLIASDLAASDQFGYDVAISSNRIVAGAPFNDDAGNRSGSAYIFERVGSAWSETAKINAFDEEAEARFGYAVDVDGGTAVVGAWRATVSGADSGAAYLLEGSESTWAQTRLEQSDPTGLDRFGIGAGIGDGVVAVGASTEDSPFSAAGSVYTYQPSVALPTISVSDITVAEGNSGSADVIITATLDAPIASAITVDWETADGTATSGDDYLSSSGTFSFAPGATQATDTVTVLGDALPENDETLTISLTNQTPGTTLDRSTALLTITNDDGTAASLSIDDLTVVEGSVGQQVASVTVELATPAATDVTVDVATEDGTAQAGSDYLAPAGQVTIPAGSTSATIDVPILGDTDNESDETFSILLSGPIPTDTVIVDGIAQVTIRNDDFSAPTLDTLAGTGVNGFSGDGGPGTDADISRPYGVAADDLGNVFFADTDNHVIRRIAPDGTISTVAGTPGSRGSNGDGGPATAAELADPFGVAIGPDGLLYIADSRNNAIRRVNADGTIETVAGGRQGLDGDGGPAVDARLFRPNRITFHNGEMFITDHLNARIRKVDAAGIITTVAGTSPGFGGDGGPATAASLNQPFGVAFDSSDNMYIADRNNHRVRRVDAATGVITTFAGGSRGFSGDGGPAADAQFSSPRDVLFDGVGNLYVADTSNRRVRVIELSSGNIATYAGVGSIGSSGDGGPATDGQLGAPYDLALGPNGEVIIGDSHVLVRRVRVVFSSGTGTN